jgi:hypothetical protein
VGDLRPYREEMMEDCLMYICLNHLSEKRGEDDEYRLKYMRSFVKKMHYLYLWGELNAFAYFDPEDVIALLSL